MKRLAYAVLPLLLVAGCSSAGDTNGGNSDGGLAFPTLPKIELPSISLQGSGVFMPHVGIMVAPEGANAFVEDDCTALFEHQQAKKFVKTATVFDPGDANTYVNRHVTACMMTNNDNSAIAIALPGLGAPATPDGVPRGARIQERIMQHPDYGDYTVRLYMWRPE